MDLKEQRAASAPRHPWETARERFFARVLRHGWRHEKGRPRSVLDVGSGDGWFASHLAAERPGTALTCWDVNYTPDLIAALASRAPGVAFVRERPQGRFDQLLLLDVLEHVENDTAFLDGLVADNLANDGRVLISVPAWPALFSAHDEGLGHYRRYRPRDGAALIRSAGLKIERGGGLFHSLLLPRLGIAAVERLGGPAARAQAAWSPTPLLGAAVRAVLAVDTFASLPLARLGMEVPGLSWWCLCRKRFT